MYKQKRIFGAVKLFKDLPDIYTSILNTFMSATKLDQIHQIDQLHQNVKNNSQSQLYFQT